MDTALVSTPCVFLLGDGICGCRLVVFDNILYLRKQPRLVLFHRKKVMGVLSNYFLGDVNLGAHSVNADHGSVYHEPVKHSRNGRYLIFLVPDFLLPKQ